MGKLYWLSDAEWGRIEPLLPRGRRGAHRVDDRRVISGIMHMLRSGARWRDCPADTAPTRRSTIASTAGAGRALWFEILLRADRHDRCDRHRGDRLAPTSRRTARQRAEKGGLRASDRPLARRAHDQNPRTDRRLRATVALMLTPGNAHDVDGARDLLALARPAPSARRQGLRRQSACASWLSQRGTEAVIPPNPTRKHPHPLRPHSLQEPQPHRAHVLPAQGLPPRRHPLRQARPKLPRWRPHRRNRNLVAQLSPDPSSSRSQVPVGLTY